MLCAQPRGGPVADRLAREFSASRIVKIYADTNTDLAKYEIRSVPTVLVYRAENLVECLAGKTPHAMMLRAFQSAA